MVTKQKATAPKNESAALKEFIRKRAAKPPINADDRRANDAIAAATEKRLAGRTPRERQVALASLKRLVIADQARVNQAAAAVVAEDEVDFMRALTSAQLAAALVTAAEAIADESTDPRFGTFVPTSEDLEVIERKLRNGVKGKWLVGYLASRTGAFGHATCPPMIAEERAARGREALKHTPAVRRVSRRAR